MSFPVDIGEIPKQKPLHSVTGYGFVKRVYRARLPGPYTDNATKCYDLIKNPRVIEWRVVEAHR